MVAHGLHATWEPPIYRPQAEHMKGACLKAWKHFFASAFKRYANQYYASRTS